MNIRFFTIFFFATKLVWTCIYAYGGEWVKNCMANIKYNIPLQQHTLVAKE